MYTQKWMIGYWGMDGACKEKSASIASKCSLNFGNLVMETGHRPDFWFLQ